MKTPSSQIDFQLTSLFDGVIEYYSLGGEEIVESVNLSSLTVYIKKNALNYEEGSIASSDGDPQKETDYQVYHDVTEWLDMRDVSYTTGYRDNFEMAAEMYYREVVAGEELSHAA